MIPRPSGNRSTASSRDLKDSRGALLPILHAIQDALGYVPPAAVPLIADGLNLSRAEVHGVVTFYHYFRDHAARPPHRADLPRRGLPGDDAARRSRRTRKQTLGVDFHETTADGAFTLEPVYCLGNCACSPSVMVDGELYGRVTPERFDEIVSPVGEAVMAADTVYVPRDAAALSLGADEVARGDRRRGASAQDGRHARAQRLARHGLARAAGRGRDAQRARRLRAGDRGRRPRRCSTRTSCTAASTAARTARSKRSRISRSSSA